MIGYILLFTGLFLSASFRIEKKGLLFMFVVITLFSGLRYGIGYDYYEYLKCCQPYSEIGERFEFVPRMIVYFSQKTFPYIFFTLTSIFISLFYYMGIRKAGKNYFLETIFYLCFPFLFYTQLGIIRQGMASAVIFFALTLRQGNRVNKSILLFQASLIVLAVLCHKSAIIAVLLFLPWEKVSKKQLWIMLFISFVAGEFIIPLFESIINIVLMDDNDNAKAIRYLYNENIGEGRFIKYLIYSIGFLSLFAYDKLLKINNINAYYVSILILGVSLFAIFSFNSTLSKRLCMFFFSISIILVPQIAKIFKFPKDLYIAMFVFLFSLQIYIGSNNVRMFQDDPGCSVSYPYRTFISLLL